MGTSYTEVYKRAITEFKDPAIKNLFDNETIMFCQVMYNFLENAISLFTSPKAAQLRVSNRISPQLYSNLFTGNGTQTQFVLVEYPTDNQLNDCIFSYKVNDISVTGTYDSVSHTVSLSAPPALNDSIEISIYYVGNWNIDLYDMEKYILSQYILSCWSEYIQNDKLDIVRLLGDTDFKLTAVSSTTTAKSNWNIVNRETATKRMNKYAWDAVYMRIY